jgi:hypothetical protein
VRFAGNDLRNSRPSFAPHRDPSYDGDYTRVYISTDTLAGFLAGFASAEAHFGATRTGHPRFVIKLRADDTAVLSLLADRFGAGRLVSVPASDRGRPQTAWFVTRLEELRHLVSVFDRDPPLGRAGRIYPHWRRLVIATDRSAASLHPAFTRMVEARRYQARKLLPVSAPSRALKEARYAAVLQAWARDAEPPYTATSYQRWRSDVAAGAPNRNTLARFFGSWREALEASGLPTEGSRSQESNARAVETAAAKRVAAALRRRAAVLREVDRCWTALGRVPTASEFLRWRLTNAPDSPGQAAFYRLFPGGWPAVLEALPPRAWPSRLHGPALSPCNRRRSRSTSPRRPVKISHGYQMFSRARWIRSAMKASQVTRSQRGSASESASRSRSSLGSGERAG